MPCLEHRRFIVVSGLPGSGKTTVGRRLAQALGLPMLDKDDILEALFDGLGVGDAEWRNRLSRAADEVLRRLADQTAGAVLASFWRHPQVTGESGTPTGWLSSLSGKIVEVHCACSPEIAAERFSVRKRHDGHLDRDKRSDDLLASFVELAARGPLGLGYLVSVDTGQAIDFDGILRQLDE
jgi:cytidylate kinase